MKKIRRLNKKAVGDFTYEKIVKWTIMFICLVIFIIGVVGALYFNLFNGFKNLFPDFGKVKIKPVSYFSCDKNKGEIAIRINFEIENESAYICTCDSWNAKPYGYFGGGIPWSSFVPPCRKYTKVDENNGIEKWPIDSSIDWSIIKNTPAAEEYGACVIYYTTRALNDGLILATQEKNKGTSYVPYSGQKGLKIIELMQFTPNTIGHLDAVFEIGKFKGEYRMKRKDCSTIARGSYVPAYFYTVFYKDAPNNLHIGNLDDIGFCVGFPVGRNEVVIVIPDSLRKDCQMLAESDSGENGARYGFFLIKKGKGSIQIERKGKISVKYSVDYTAKNRSSDLTEEEVKSKCPKWESFDLTFIKGVKEPRKLIYAGQSEPRRRSACMAEIGYLSDKKLIEGSYQDYDVNLKDTVELGDNERICCYAKLV